MSIFLSKWASKKFDLLNNAELNYSVKCKQVNDGDLKLLIKWFKISLNLNVVVPFWIGLIVSGFIWHYHFRLH